MAAIELGSTTLNGDANLQAYYKAENVNDSKGSNNLTNHNSVAFNAAKFNNGFDGSATNTNKYLTVANKLGYTGGAYSISFWLKMQAEVGVAGYENLMEIVDSVSQTTFEWEYLESAGTRTLSIVRTKLGVASAAASYNITLGTTNTYNLIFTYDGTNILGYVNGTQQMSASQTGNGSSGTSDSFTILNGRGATTPASAIIDDVALFDRKLTTTEIDLINNGPSGGGNFLQFFN